jgi:probable addiction module antidote protein
MTINKHKGSNFDAYLHDGLRDSDELVFLHIKDALEEANLSHGDDYQYLIKAIADVAKARGKTEFLDKSGISRQGLHKILTNKSVPSIQNIIALLKAIGLRFSVEKIGTVISENVPANVLDVAQYVRESLPLNSTFMKLQKIVYYAQAESLVHFNRPLFDARIEAWASGPVVQVLFDKHKGLKNLTNRITLGNADNLSAEQKTCISFAIEKYGNLDRETLSHLTHLEDPWKNARAGLADHARSKNEITVESIRAFYSRIPDYAELDEEVG